MVNLKREAAGRLPPDYPQLQCHTGSLLDFEFMPYNNNHLATCSSDGLIKFWELPDDVKAMTNLQPLLTLLGHTKKVNLLTWSSGVKGLLASSCIDYSLKLWDVL